MLKVNRGNPQGKPREQGFTLVEVLIASTVLAVALAGILGMGLNALKRSSMPDDVAAAALLAAERLAYFRAQTNPYKAAGGTYYPPPTSKTSPDYNLSPEGDALHVVADSRPVLFVREYLHGTEERQFSGDAGRDFQRQRMGGTVNHIAPTNFPLNFGGVVPNVDTAAEVTINASAGFTFVPAPRANNALRAGSNLPDTITHVREVWIQTNNPNFANVDMPSNFDITTLADTTLGGIRAPAMQTNLPPFTVAVTVRVFRRDPACRILSMTDLGNDGAGRAIIHNKQLPGYPGLGYDRTRPLASTVGYFGLRRI